MLGLKCESNPELDPYIKKPKFSRDRNDYKVWREGYESRKLVCPEKARITNAEHKIRIYETVPCTDVPEFADVLTIVTENEGNFKSLEVPIVGTETSAGVSQVF